MKKLFPYAAALLLIPFQACDFLEAPPSTGLNEDGVFADRTLTERYITGIYAEGLPLGFSMGSSGIDRGLCATSTHAGACDEAESGTSWDKTNVNWNVNNHNNNDIDWEEDPRHDTRWSTIRNATSSWNASTRSPTIRGIPISTPGRWAKPTSCGRSPSGKGSTATAACRSLTTASPHRRAARSRATPSRSASNSSSTTATGRPNSCPTSTRTAPWSAGRHASRRWRSNRVSCSMRRAPSSTPTRRTCRSAARTPN